MPNLYLILQAEQNSEGVNGQDAASLGNAESLFTSEARAPPQQPKTCESGPLEKVGALSNTYLLYHNLYLQIHRLIE